MLLVIDNYDSFTYNLVHYAQELGAQAHVIRNDDISAADALDMGAKAVLLSLANTSRQFWTFQWHRQSF